MCLLRLLSLVRFRDMARLIPNDYPARSTSKPTRRQTARMRPRFIPSAIAFENCQLSCKAVVYDFSVQIQFVSTVSFPFGLMNFPFNIVRLKRKVKPETAIAHEVVLSSRGLPVLNACRSLTIGHFSPQKRTKKYREQVFFTKGWISLQLAFYQKENSGTREMRVRRCRFHLRISRNRLTCNEKLSF